MNYSLEYIRRITSPEYLMEDAMRQVERMGLRYEYEERAAILEYDGGLSRAEAEAQALREITGRTTI